MPSSAEDPRQSIHLHLAAGGLRAMLGGAGAVLFLMLTDRWGDVSRIVSVSGGSVPNAALLAGSGELSDFDRLIEHIRRVSEDRGRWWVTRGRVVTSVMMTALTLGIASLLVSAMGVGPAALLFPQWINVVVGAFAFPVWVTFARWAVSRYWSDVVRSLLPLALNDLSGVCSDRSDRVHDFVSTRFSSGTGVVLRAGGLDAGGATSVSRSYCLVSGSEISVSDAVRASTAFPFVQGASVATRCDTDGHLERLVDGGTSGHFGPLGEGQSGPHQVQGSARPHGKGSAETVIVDAVRQEKLRPDGPIVRLASRIDRVSAVSHLMRWVTIRGEAVYRRDLESIEDSTHVRLCRSDSDTSELPVGRLDAAMSTLRAANTRVGLVRVSHDDVETALTAGFVGTYLAMDPNPDAADLIGLLERACVMVGRPGGSCSIDMLEVWNAHFGRTSGLGVVAVTEQL